jgi:hypothetical protein
MNKHCETEHEVVSKLPSNYFFNEEVRLKQKTSTGKELKERYD